MKNLNSRSEKLAYILEVTKWGNKGIKNRGRFQGLQIGARRIVNRGSLRDLKLEQKDYKSGQIDFKSRQVDFKSGQERFQTGVGISNRGRDYKSVHNNNHINSRI